MGLFDKIQKSVEDAQQRVNNSLGIPEQSKNELPSTDNFSSAANEALTNKINGIVASANNKMEKINKNIEDKNEKRNELAQKQREIEALDKKHKKSSRLDDKILRKEYDLKNKQLIAEMTVTGRSNGFIWDDDSQIFVIPMGLYEADFVVNYDSLKDVKLNEDVTTITEGQSTSKRKGVLTRSVAGAVLGAGVGAVIGGATAKKQNNGTTISKNIVTKTITLIREDPYTPVINIVYDEGAWYKLTSILKNNQSSDSQSISDELSKLAKLKNDGVITQNEFDDLKNKIINK